MLASELFCPAAPYTADGGKREIFTAQQKPVHRPKNQRRKRGKDDVKNQRDQVHPDQHAHEIDGISQRITK
tara:strand:+ start:881 stop:1093 length:213 start_codon:yes stop_codon:yes gene_type:complete